MDGRKGFTAYPAVVLATVLWGFLGLVTRNLDDEGFTPFEVMFVRMAVCTVILLAGIVIFDRASLRISRKDIWLFVFLGVFKILVDLLIYLAQIRIDLALATVLQFTCPYFVLLFSVFLFGERMTARKVIAIVVATIGCVLVTGLDKGADIEVIGCALALGSGISYAVYLVGSKLLLDRGYSENCTLLYIFLIGTILMAPFSDPADLVSHVTGIEPVLNLLAMGVLMTLVPYYLMAYALKHGNAVKVNMLGLLEVVFATLVGFLLFGEVLGWTNLLGVALVPLSIILMSTGEDAADGSNPSS